ncbi:hypothetical protein P692DRAFT_201873310 [Suillus brevipes Sb2]|nr:hypothetical protein P692DRAFT_201873310 [Suillus brevipes Sb2]
MAPKTFFTSPAAKQFVRLYLHKDITQLATDFESTILASSLLLNTSTNHCDCVAKAKTAIRIGLRASLCEVTNDLSATMEFTQYHNLGGIEGLENLVNAIESGTCHFVPISSEELEDHLQCVKNREKLTPESNQSTPMHSPTLYLSASTGSRGVDVDVNDFSHDNSFAGEINHEPDVNTSPSTAPTGSTFNEPTPFAAPTGNTFNELTHVSTFTDDMLDLALHTHTSRTTDTSQHLVSPAPPHLPVNSSDCLLTHLETHAL